MNPLVTYGDSDDEANSPAAKGGGGLSLVNYSGDDDSDAESPAPDSKPTQSPSKRQKTDAASAQEPPVAIPASTAPAAAAIDDSSSASATAGVDVTVSASCDPEAQATVAAMLAAHGSRFIAEIRSKKEFNNPYTLEKVSKYTGVDTFGTHFPRNSPSDAGPCFDAFTTS